MLVSNNTLESLASRFVVGRKTLDALTQESFSLVTPATATPAAAALSSKTDDAPSQGSARDNTGWNESFARMMLSLKTQADTSLSEETAASDNGVISGLPTAATDEAAYSPIQQQFLDYMQQPAEDRLREQLTGVSKEEYEAMSPEEQRGVDDRFKQALQQRQEVVQEDINTRIKALKAGLIA